MPPVDNTPETSASDARERVPPIVIGITVVVALGGFLFGYDTGVISGALPFIAEDLDLSTTMSGVVVSSILVGAMAGALGSGRVADRFGRRTVIIGAAAIFTAGSVLAALSPSALALIGARFILGLGVGIASALVPVFIAEVAPPASRGRLIAVNQLLITIGIVASYAVGYAFASSHNWRAMFAVAAVPALALGVGMFLLPESPRWLVARGREADARRVLARVRPGRDIDVEVAEINRVRPEGTVRPAELGRRWVRPALIAGVGLQVFGQATGVNTVIYYAPTIFDKTGLGISTALLATVGIGIVNVVMTLVGMAFVDRIGRRPLLISGVSIMTLALATLAATLSFAGLSDVSGVVAFVCIALYIAAVAASLNVVVFMIPSEIYPLRVRGTAMSVTLFSNWGMNFLVSLTFLTLLQALGTAGTFWLYAGFCGLTVCFAVVFIPETRNRTLEQIETSLRAPASSGRT